MGNQGYIRLLKLILPRRFEEQQFRRGIGDSYRGHLSMIDLLSYSSCSLSWSVGMTAG